MIKVMVTVGRNAPCPCGSGTKYKKCCLAKDEREAALRGASPAPPASGPTWVLEDDDLEDLSNSVIDLVRARRYDEALAACRRLLEEFPEVVDGLEHSGMVHAAMGNHETAADFYRKAYDFVTHPSRRDDYDHPEHFREQAEKEERLAPRR